MARGAGKDDDRAGDRDEAARVLHDLSNTLHALALRLFALDRSGIPPEARGHVAAARRLAEQSGALVAELRDRRPATAPTAALGRLHRRLTRNRNPR